MVRRLAASSAVLLLLSASWTVASVCKSVRTHDWVWFQRSGSILTFAGAVLVGRAIVRLGRSGAKPSSPFGFGTITGSRHDSEKGVVVSLKLSEASIAKDREDGRDSSTAVIAVVMGLQGTIIWGYGDLVGGLFKP